MLFSILLIFAAFSGISCYTDDATDIIPTLHIYKGENTSWLSKEYDFKPKCGCRIEPVRKSTVRLEYVVRVKTHYSEHGNSYAFLKYQCEVNITRVDDKSEGVMICSLYDNIRHFIEERVNLVLQKREIGQKGENGHITRSLDTINHDPNEKSVSLKKDHTGSNEKPKHVTVTLWNPNVTEPQVKYLPLGEPWTWKFKEMENITSCKCYILNANGKKLDFGKVTIKKSPVNQIKKDTCELSVPEVNDHMNGLMVCDIITAAGVHTIEEALFSSNAANTESSGGGWMVATCILIVALLVMTAVLLWLLLRKRCTTMWSPKEHKEQLFNEVVTRQNQDSTGKYEETIDNTSNKASYAVTTPPKPAVKPAVSHKPDTDQKPAESRLSATDRTDVIVYDRKPSTTENSNENKIAETPRPMVEVVERNGFEMPVAAVTTNSSMGHEKSPDSPSDSSAKLSSISGDQVQEPTKTAETMNPDNYQLNMIKSCFGEAITRMNKKKPLIPKKPSRKSLKGASSTEDLEDYDLPANIARAVGQLNNAKSSETIDRPTSAMTQNDLYVSADDADEEYDKPANILRSILDAGLKTPLIRPPTAFITEDDLKTAAAAGRGEYDTRSFVRPAIASPRFKSSKEAAIDKESDAEEDDLYDFPSSLLRKLSYPRT